MRMCWQGGARANTRFRCMGGSSDVSNADKMALWLIRERQFGAVERGVAAVGSEDMAVPGQTHACR